jgi:PIN domain nuclease of toxin-antitoxin system
MVNIDTHIFLFGLAGELSAHERKILAGKTTGISAIVLWEVAKLYIKQGRVNVSLEDPDLLRALAGMTVWPVDRNVCRRLLELDFTSDPADELIAATSLAYNAPLLTRDRHIRSSQRVPLA